METPRYRTLEKAFFAPTWVDAGAEVETEAPPGPHLLPLNRAAAQRMEAWLTEEHDEIDPKTKQPTGRKVRPHERYRRQAYVSAARHTAVVVKTPTLEDKQGQSLSEIMAARKSTDQRPGPVKAAQGPSMEELLADATAPALEEAPAPTASIVAPAPKPAIQASKSVPG